MQVYLNGVYGDAGLARVSVRDRGFLLGDGAFETLAARIGQPVWLGEHLARLRRSADVLGIPVPEGDDALAEIVQNLLERNGLSDATAVVRITLTRGPGGRGVLPPAEANPNLLVTAAEVPAAPSKPARVTLSAVARSRGSPTASIKCLNYADNIVARMRADALGCDEALLRNDAGRLACATAANLFLVAGGVVATPALSEAVLPGITRATVIATARSLGFTVEERPVEADELGRADALFLTNSLIGVRPVGKVVDEAAPHQELFSGRENIVTDQLAAAVRQAESGAAD